MGGWGEGEAVEGCIRSVKNAREINCFQVTRVFEMPLKCKRYTINTPAISLAEVNLVSIESFSI